jgi:hypothetical protein
MPQQHCPEDLACLHCCSCWSTRKKEYEGRLTCCLEKYKKGQKQIEFLEHLNKELTKQLDESKKK